MSSSEYTLAPPPSGERALELWLQHAAGFILFEDVRQYAIERIDATLSPEARAAVQKGIDDTMYGLMQVIDGVTGSLTNSTQDLHIDFVVRLVGAETGRVVAEMDLRDGDGVCMGVHGWAKGDFGTSPIASRSDSSSRRATSDRSGSRVRVATPKGGRKKGSAKRGGRR